MGKNIIFFYLIIMDMLEINWKLVFINYKQGGVTKFQEVLWTVVGIPTKVCVGKDNIPEDEIEKKDINNNENNKLSDNEDINENELPSDTLRRRRTKLLNKKK